VEVLDWPACIPDIKEDPGMLSSYNPFTNENGTTFLFQRSTVSQIPSIPRCLWIVVKSGDATQW